MTRPPFHPITRDLPPSPGRGLDTAITAALTAPPVVTVPPAFAQVVAQRASSVPPPSPARWLGWGPRLALGSAALLTAGLFALAPHTIPSLSNLRFDAQLVLLTELSGLLLFAHRLLTHD